MMYPSNSPWSPYLPAPVTSEEGPAPARQHGLWSGRYARVTGILVIAITVLAIAAAAAGMALTAQVSSVAAPTSWGKAFTGTLDNTSKWTGDDDCQAGPNGLDVLGTSGWDVCQFAPSSTSDLVSNGFQLNLTLAPEIGLSDALTPLIQVTDSNGNGLSVIFDDTGNFAICHDTASDCSACLGVSLGCPSTDGVLVSDSSVAWHTDPYVGNDVVIRYQVNPDDSGTLFVFASGQQIADTTIGIGLGQGFSIAIGAGSGGEALYTGATLYTASD